MGQVCSGGQESSKAGLLDVPSSSDTGDYADSSPDSLAPPHEASGNDPTANDSTVGTTHQNEHGADGHTPTAASAALAALERRKRRELWIVNGAARGMVAVRSTRGSTGYYDQGFAGLLAQHLEQTTSFPSRLPLVLPAAAPLKPREVSGDNDDGDGNPGSNSAVSGEGGSPLISKASTAASDSKKCTFYDRLAQPPWEGMEIVVPDASSKLRGREASAAASGDPHKLMDALAESLLDGPYTVLPAKQQLFAGVRPMVENLL